MISSRSHSLRSFTLTFGGAALLVALLTNGGCDDGIDVSPDLGTVDNGVARPDTGTDIPCPSPCTTPQVCGPTGVCQDGADGDPCTAPHQCTGGLVCGPDSCQDGNAGDPCEIEGHCASDLFCTTAETCQTGLAGSPCDFDTDCVSDPGGRGIFACGETTSMCETVECRVTEHCSLGQVCNTTSYTCVDPI